MSCSFLQIVAPFEHEMLENAHEKAYSSRQQENSASFTMLLCPDQKVQMPCWCSSCRVRKHRMPVLAGTIPCPTCNNRPTVIRHTPNFEKLFKLENPWVLSVRALPMARGIFIICTWQAKWPCFYYLENQKFVPQSFHNVTVSQFWFPSSAMPEACQFVSKKALSKVV